MLREGGRELLGGFRESLKLETSGSSRKVSPTRACVTFLVPLFSGVEFPSLPFHTSFI